MRLAEYNEVLECLTSSDCDGKTESLHKVHQKFPKWVSLKRKVKVFRFEIQWKLSITRSLGPGNFVCYIRYFVISVVKKQYKTKQINSLGPEKIVCYIRYFVISDLVISSFHCSLRSSEVFEKIFFFNAVLVFWMIDCGNIYKTKGGIFNVCKQENRSLQSLIWISHWCIINFIYFHLFPENLLSHFILFQQIFILDLGQHLLPTFPGDWPS